MDFDNLGGRKDKRHPIMVLVDITRLAGDGAERERTYTDNISAHGVRVHSRRPWQLGEQVEIIPLKENAVRGEVVYRQERGQNQFFVGIKFRQRRFSWRILQRFGMAIMGMF